MKKLTLLFVIILFFFSCSEDSLLLGENMELSESSELSEHEDLYSENDSDVRVENRSAPPLPTFNPCYRSCAVKRLKCTKRAQEDFKLAKEDCRRNILFIGYKNVDKLCWESVFVGYKIVKSPEGETHKVAQYKREQVVCGTDRVAQYSTSPTLLARYRRCVRKVTDKFVDEFDDCDIAYAKCVKEKCKKKPDDKDDKEDNKEDNKEGNNDNKNNNDNNENNPWGDDHN